MPKTRGKKTTHQHYSFELTKSVKPKIKKYKKLVKHYKRKYEGARAFGRKDWHLRNDYKTKYETCYDRLKQYCIIGELQQKQNFIRKLKRLKSRNAQSLRTLKISKRVDYSLQN